MFFAEQKQKSNLSKFKYVVTQDYLIKKSLKNESKNTVIFKPKLNKLMKRERGEKKLK